MEKLFRISVLHVVILCFYSFPLWAQYNMQQATDLVLNQLLSGELDQVDVFMIDEALSDQDTIFLGNNDTVVLPYSSNWVFFVDDYPFANWAHPVRFIFVNESTGTYQAVNKDFFPVNWPSAYTTLSEMERPTGVDLPVNPDAVIDGIDPNPNLYAVIICGGNQKRFWRDVSAIYCTLLDEYGFTKENIFVHYRDGTSIYGEDLDGPEEPSDDIDYDAHKYTIYQTLMELAGHKNEIEEIPELGPEDGLFIFIDGHGYERNGHSYVDLPDFDLEDSELGYYMEDINCAQIIVVLQPCFMGGFKTELSDYVNYDVHCKNRSVHTASDNESSWWEVWVTGGHYCEFVYYWTAAARGNYPDNNSPWELSDYEAGSFPFSTLIPGLEDHPGDYDPDVNGDGFVQMEEAFNYANALDTWSDDDYYYNPKNPGIEEKPQEFTNISFNEDLLTLCGLAGHVEQTQTVEKRNYLVGDNLQIDPEVSLSFADGTGLYLGNENSNVTVSTGGLLDFGNNMNIYGSEQNRIIVNGNIEVGTGVIFKKYENATIFNGLILNNNQMSTNLNQITFNQAQLYNYGVELNITNCDFNDCISIHSYSGDVSVSGLTTFYNTCFTFDDRDGGLFNTVTVTNCNFTGDNTFYQSAINIEL